MALKRRRKRSKSSGNKRRRRKSIKLKRKFSKKRTIKRRRKIHGGGPLEWLGFGKNKNNKGNIDTPQSNPLVTQVRVNDPGTVQKIRDTVQDAEKAVDKMRVQLTDRLGLLGTEQGSGNKSTKTLLNNLRSGLNKIIKNMQDAEKFLGNNEVQIIQQCSEQKVVNETAAVQPERIRTPTIAMQPSEKYN